MAGSVNKVILIGNLGADPEIRKTQDGRSIASLSLATNERWRNKQTGEQQERTEWHRVAVFSEGLVNIIERYLRKGAKIYIEGQLRTRKWQDKSGQDRYTTEIVIQGFNGVLTMLDGLGEARTPSPSSSSSRESQMQQGESAAKRYDLDDDIPF